MKKKGKKESEIKVNRSLGSKNISIREITTFWKSFHFTITNSSNDSVFDKGKNRERRKKKNNLKSKQRENYKLASLVYFEI